MIELRNERFKASVDLQGGWLVSFSDAAGNILFPRTEITYPDGAVKLRGGSHVCLPNFGPGGDMDLPQHGFGRNLDWKITSQAHDSVTLELTGGSQTYTGLVSRLTYDLTPTGICMRLELHNDGDTPLPVAPGFHPYFQIRSVDTFIAVDGNELAFDDLSEMKLIEADEKDMWLAGRRLHLSSSMKHWAHWTDRAGGYLCVEPTLNGNAFLEGGWHNLHPTKDHQTYLSIDIL